MPATETLCPTTGEECPRLLAIQILYFSDYTGAELSRTAIANKEKDRQLGCRQIANVVISARENPGRCIEAIGECGVPYVGIKDGSPRTGKFMLSILKGLKRK